MEGKPKTIALGGIGFCLYRSAATYLYNTGMGSVDVSTGFVSDLGFVFAVNLSFCLAALFLLAAIHAGRFANRPIPQWPAIAAVAVGLVLNEYPFWPPAVEETIYLASAVLCGFAFMIFCAAWLEIFIAQSSASDVLKQIVVGYIMYAILSCLFAFLPTMPDALLSLIFLLTSSLVVRTMRDTVMADRYSTLAIPPDERFSFIAIAVCFFVLTGVVGLMHTSVLGSASESMIATVPMWSARIVAVMTFLVIVFLMGQQVNPSTIFKILFPALIAILSLMPFLGEAPGAPTGTIAIICYEICGMVFFFFLVREGRRLRLSSYFLACVYMIGSSSFLLAGLGIGLGLQALSASFGFSLLTLLAFVAIYPLILVLMLLLKRDRKVETPEGATDQNTAKNTKVDRTAAFAERFDLTKREREILEYLSRGRSIRYIAETLVISENTAWTHTKRIYAKTGVHSKQELMSLIEDER